MELYLQFGWGMMEHCRTLIQEWGGGTVILSPRDLNTKQMIRLGRDIQNLGGAVLLDSQFYLPRADHHRLTSHNYWPDDYDTVAFAGEGRQLMMQKLVELNRQIGTTHFIIPGERAETINNIWLESQWGFLEAARETTEQPLIATICLSGEAVRWDEQISLVMAEAERMNVSGYYLVIERPGLAYLVDDPHWLANTLDLAAGLRRLGANVIVGYSNHQQLILRTPQNFFGLFNTPVYGNFPILPSICRGCKSQLSTSAEFSELIMACAGVSAIASGTWMNVRSFFPDKFRSNYEEEIKRRTTWYYCPQALSEYTLPYLDIGVRLGLGSELRSEPRTPYADPLFAVRQPSASGWSEPDAFRHYLMALYIQVQSSTRSSFDETVTAHQALLDRAENNLKCFRENGVISRKRDFWDALDANRAALIILERTHGPILRRKWVDLV